LTALTSKTVLGLIEFYAEQVGMAEPLPTLAQALGRQVSSAVDAAVRHWAEQLNVTPEAWAQKYGVRVHLEWEAFKYTIRVEPTRNGASIEYVPQAVNTRERWP
jgi:hypothetical protein